VTGRGSCARGRVRRCSERPPGDGLFCTNPLVPLLAVS
jgi:hypothetical protein